MNHEEDTYLKKGSHLSVNTHRSENDSDRRETWYYVLLFFLWPLLSLIVAIRNYKRPASRHIVTLFCGFIGMMFLVGGGSDGVRYREHFLQYTQYSFSDLWMVISGFIFEQTNADISREVIFYLVSRFTSDPIWLWTTLGLMFGFIYSKNIWFLIKQADKKVNVNSLVFLIAILFIITPIQGINQFRFWIAAHVFFYGAMHVVMFKNPNYFAVTLLAPFMHFGLLLPNIALFIFYFLGRRDSIYIPLAIMSVFFAEIDFRMLSGYVEFLGPAFEDRFEGYTADRAFHRAEDLQERNWYLVWWQPLLLYMTYAMLTYSRIRFSRELPHSLLNLFSFLLILVTIFNLISHFPMIYRYRPVLFLFVFAFLFLVYIHLGDQKMDLAILPCFIPILLMIVVQTRIMFEFVSVTIFIFNPLFALLGKFETTIWEFIM